jgi:glycerol-3-phosphate O-acyltransferase
MLDTALCELAVLRVSGGSGAGTDPVEAFWTEIGWLRDLLKFEFYFKDRDEHRRQVREEMDRHDPDWEERLRAGPAGADALLARMRPLVSHLLVRPFVEAYRLVADVLTHDDAPGTLADAAPGALADAAPGALADDAEVIRRALGLGRQYVAQRRLRSSEAVSVLLFQTALQLMRNRGLLEAGSDMAERRRVFLAELRDLLKRLDQIEDLAIRRYIRDGIREG